MVKEVVKVEEAANAVATTGAFDMMFEASGAGMSSVRAEDMAIPFLAIIQSGSPQRKKQDGQYISGADEGMVFNTVTQELFDITGGNEPLEVLLCGFKKKLLHWRDRDQGGGMLGQYDIDDPIAKDAERQGGRFVLPDGTYLVETAEHYLLVKYPNGSVKRVVLAMSSTQLKKSRRLMTMVSEKQLRHPGTGRYFTPPPFAYTYKLSTQPEKNDTGDWHGWKIQEGRPLDLASDDDKALFELAYEFSKSIDKGDVKTADNRGDAEHASPGMNNSAGRGKVDVDDSDIPF